MTLCAVASLTEVDDDLNKKYREIERRIADDPAATQRLKAAERAWVAFRDAECAFRSSGGDGGSMSATVEAGCMESLTRDRLEVFEDYLSCSEYDVGCPVPSMD